MLDMQNNELWKPIPGFEGAYEASTLGYVRSVPRITNSPVRGIQNRKGKILSGGIGSHGYRTVTLYAGDGKRVNRTVHSLISETFIGPIRKGWAVDHIDGDRLNNSLNNLRYVERLLNARNVTKVVAESGKIGVSRNGSGWMAQAMMDGNRHYLGTYRTVEEAAAAREAFEKRVNFRGLEPV